MRLVRENINFERGLEPRKSMGIGRETLMKQIDWALNFFPAALDDRPESVSYTHLRAHETVLDLVCRLLLEKKKTIKYRSV